MDGNVSFQSPFPSNEVPHFIGTIRNTNESANLNKVIPAIWDVRNLNLASTFKEYCQESFQANPTTYIAKGNSLCPNDYIGNSQGLLIEDRSIWTLVELTPPYDTEEYNTSNKKTDTNEHQTQIDHIPIKVVFTCEIASSTHTEYLRRRQINIDRATIGSIPSRDYCFYHLISSNNLYVNINLNRLLIYLCWTGP